MKYYLIILFTAIHFIGLSQDCDCESNFNWLKETFEKNDAGFAYAIEQKGEGAYEKHNEEFLQRAKEITELTECTPLLYDWLTFFRSGHISISLLGNGQSNTSNTDQPEVITKPDHEVYAANETKFAKRAKKIKSDSFEGIWYSAPYKVLIQKRGEDYVGSILEAPGTGWKKDQVKLVISPKDDGYTINFFMRDFSERSSDDVRFMGKNTLKAGLFHFERVSPTFEEDPSMKLYLETLNASEPFITEIDADNVLLRIPSFGYQNKQMIDSILQANHELITSHKNLMIDIRDNGGGSDSSYGNIIPYLYTQPIRVIGVEMLSTELNNQRMLSLAEREDTNEDSKKWFKEMYEKLEKQRGEFVKMNEYMVSKRIEDTVYQYPERVAILINEYVGSTSEQFLLAAKQSQKVKLYGTTTAGVLDISNMHFVPSPCNEFELGYSLSRSMRIPKMAIDGKGIMPDYYLDETIPDEEWIDFVLEVLNPKNEE